MDLARRDSGSIVIGWLTKLVVAIAVVGVALFDSISIGAARLGATDDASAAAEAAGASYRTSHDVQAAYQAALETLPSSSESLPPQQFVVQSDSTVDLVLRRTTNTLLARRIGPLKKYVVVVVHGESVPPTL
jgi:hypothetical protein